MQGVETAPSGGGWSSCNSSHLGLVDFQVVGAGAMLRTGRVYVGVGLLGCRVGSDVAVALLVLPWGSTIRSCLGLLQCPQAPRAGCQKLRQSRREMQSNARALLLFTCVCLKHMVRAVYCVSQQTNSNKVKSTRHNEQAGGAHTA